MFSHKWDIQLDNTGLKIELIYIFGLYETGDLRQEIQDTSNSICKLCFVYHTAVHWTTFQHFPLYITATRINILIPHAALLIDQIISKSSAEFCPGIYLKSKSNSVVTIPRRQISRTDELKMLNVKNQKIRGLQLIENQLIKE